MGMVMLGGVLFFLCQTTYFLQQNVYIFCLGEFFLLTSSQIEGYEITMGRLFK